MARYINAFEFKQKLLEERDKIPLTITQRYSFGVPEINRYGANVRCGIRTALRCMERTQTAHVVEYEEYKRVCKERDAAVRDLKLAMQRDFSECVICKHYGDYPRQGKCRECFQGAENNFEWRGIADDE